jgi:hypothetical protein
MPHHTCLKGVLVINEESADENVVIRTNATYDTFGCQYPDDFPYVLDLTRQFLVLSRGST